MTPEENKRLQREFSIAGWNGMMKDLRRILNAHPDAVHWTDHMSGMTALHGAAAQCHTDVIQWLLEKGSDINARDDKGRTPLMHAAGNGGKDHLQPLLDAGADIGAVDNDGHDAIWHTSDGFPQPQNADHIRRHARVLEEKKQREEEIRRQADIEGAAGEMRTGTAKSMPVGKPLRLKF
ncbi:MAG: ankyrin repeat domain-containing protein [Alphaproteobacteria bacterium]